MRNCKQRKMFKYIGQGEMVQRPQKLKIASCLEGLKYIVNGANGFDFASHWLENWRESFQPITKGSNRNDVITFDSHLKIALKRL